MTFLTWFVSWQNFQNYGPMIRFTKALKKVFNKRILSIQFSAQYTIDIESEWTINKNCEISENEMPILLNQCFNIAKVRGGNQELGNKLGKQCCPPKKRLDCLKFLRMNFQYYWIWTRILQIQTRFCCHLSRAVFPKKARLEAS